MITILLASARIAAGRLDVPVGYGANPHVGPGRRNGKRADAVEHLPVRERAALRTQVGKSLAGLPASQSRPLVRHIAQPRLRGGLFRIDNLPDILCVGMSAPVR